MQKARTCVLAFLWVANMCTLQKCGIEPIVLYAPAISREAGVNQTRHYA
ncbi:hypothetical protein SAMN03159495_3647 [Pseudomonas sp. NFR16]|nr:hypothetical protein SAMN03159495_3647 [Pseudomonas sp. NFR16]